MVKQVRSMVTGAAARWEESCVVFENGDVVINKFYQNNDGQSWSTSSKKEITIHGIRELIQSAQKTQLSDLKPPMSNIAARSKLTVFPIDSAKGQDLVDYDNGGEEVHNRINSSNASLSIQDFVSSVCHLSEIRQ